MDSNALPLVIIGTGLAGYNLAREWRKLDADSSLIMISRDSGRSYSKPMLSTGFQKNKSAEDLSMADPGAMAEQLNASILSYHEVTQIDSAGKKIEVDGTSINYRDLVLATGSRPITLPIPNTAEQRTFSINDLEEYAAFREAVKEGSHIGIIGGGLIGCEYANDLALAGYQVTLIERENRLLATLVPEAISSALAAHFEERGIKLIFNASATEISQHNDDVIISLDNDDAVTCTNVLSAVGVRAEITLAKKADLATNNGIVVDRMLKTSVEHIYALGDAAEVAGQLNFYIMPMMLSARALAKTLAGTPTPVSYPAMPIAIKTTEYPIVTNPPASQGEWIIETFDDGIAAKCYAGDQLIGFALSGSQVIQRAKLAKEVPAKLG